MEVLLSEWNRRSSLQSLVEWAMLQMTNLIEVAKRNRLYKDIRWERVVFAFLNSLKETFPRSFNRLIDVLRLSLFSLNEKMKRSSLSWRRFDTFFAKMRVRGTTNEENWAKNVWRFSRKEPEKIRWKLFWQFVRFDEVTDRLFFPFRDIELCWDIDAIEQNHRVMKTLLWQNDDCSLFCIEFDHRQLNFCVSMWGKKFVVWLLIEDN